MLPNSISAIVVCFNHERFVAPCLESIKKQTCRPSQLIVLDDASTDDSQAAISSWLAANWPEAVVVFHRENRGICATLNEALALCTSEFVAIVAADDRWYPNRIEYHLNNFRGKSSQVAAVYSDATIIDEFGRQTGQQFIAMHRPELRPPSGQVFSSLAAGNFIPAMSVTVRTEALREAGGYNESFSYEDYDMWMRLAGSGKQFAFLPGSVAEYRIVSTSMSRTLFVRPTARHSLTLLAIYDRWFHSRDLPEPTRRQWRKKMIQAAYNLYVQEHPSAVRWLLLTGLRDRNIRFIALAAAGSIGLDRAKLVRIFRFLRVSKT